VGQAVAAARARRLRRADAARGRAHPRRGQSHAQHGAGLRAVERGLEAEVAADRGGEQLRGRDAQRAARDGVGAGGARRLAGFLARLLERGARLPRPVLLLDRLGLRARRGGRGGRKRQQHDDEAQRGHRASLAGASARSCRTLAPCPRCDP
jgi:hypothetical protein